jgi:hypothetical protein
MALRTRIAVIVYGYLVVVSVLGIFLALQQLLPRDVYGIHLDKLTSPESFVVSVIVVAPVILGLLWDRVRGFKIFEIELVLGQASPTINIELASAIQNSKGSLTMHLVETISSAIAQPDLKLVEVNLRCRPYWWTTRLFLLAALTEKYTNVKRLVFVKHDALRVFVGAATPASVRQALGKRFPVLDETFARVLTAAGADNAECNQQQVLNQIGWMWPAQMFPRNGDLIGEEEFREEISVQMLCELLGIELQTEARQWSGAPPGRRLYAKILSCETPFVPLLIGPRLAKVVDRRQLAERLAVAAVT